ncbi:Ni/Co efflux regulator RcnB [Ochrobactrum sp. 19YEA23]|nr:Ni/Co efflux regulator RcnB [Ochrobactrum sp. RH2CCR150]MDH7786692.1 Ni/Co efflux regulator RcnB [Ochrobactrum sp. 19YEA23]
MMFKKVILAAVALSFIGAPLAAQAQDYQRKPGPHRMEQKPRPSHGKEFGRNDRRDHGRQHWSKGQRYNDWRRHPEVRDYNRYGLRRPGPGQRWVKVDNQFLLVTTATGIIAGILAGR